MKKSFLCFLTFSFCLSFALLGFAPANAEEDDMEAFVLEEVTVTAEKREVNIQNLPMSVTAVSGADIRDKGQTTLDSALQDIAGLMVGGYTQGSTITIRGMQGTQGDSQDPSTALIIDGVYSERGERVIMSMFDMERVEVLRGPQGTIYGSNAIGGIVNLVSKEPTDEFETYLNTQIGDYNLKHFDGAVNFPISEKLAARIAFYKDNRDGYLSNGQDDSDKLSARLRVSYNPTETLSFLAAIERNEDSSQVMTSVPLEGSAGNLPAGFPWVDEFDVDAGWVVPVGSDPWTMDEWHPYDWYVYDIEFTTISFKMDWDLGFGNLIVEPSYQETKRGVYGDMFRGTAGVYTQEEVRHMDGERWSGEVRIVSPEDSPFEWIVGYYAMESENRDNIYDDNFFDWELTTGSTAGWQMTTVTEPGNTSAFFGQLTYPVAERLRLTGGMRYSADTRSINYRYGHPDLTDSSDPYYDLAVITDDGRREYMSDPIVYDASISSTTYKAAVEYDVADNSMLYAMFSTGFKAGGLNRSAPPTTYDPETLYSYEIGSKNYFFDRRLKLNIGAYLYDYRDMQIQWRSLSEIADTEVEGMSLIVLNADKSTNTGLEVESDYLLTQNDRVKVSFTYMNTEYGATSYPGYEDTLVGTEMLNAPTWMWNLGYEHRWALENGSELSLSFDTRISDGYRTTIEEGAGNWQSRYNKTNAYANYYAPSGKWNIGLWMKNIENDAQILYAATDFYRAKITAPRTFGVNLSLKY